MIVGFAIDSQWNGYIFDTKEKASIEQLCHVVPQEKFLIIRKIERFLGKFTSSFPAVCFGQLHYMSLERHRIIQLKFAKGNFNKEMEVVQVGKIVIFWWTNNIEDSFTPIKNPDCCSLLKIDACKSGWDSMFDKESTGRYFALDESIFDINVLKLKATFFGLEHSWNHLRQTHIKVLSYNTIANNVLQIIVIWSGNEDNMELSHCKRYFYYCLIFLAFLM